MFRFEQPSWLLLLLVPPFLAWVWRRMRHRLLQSYADAAMLPWVQVRATGVGQRAWTLWALAAAWTLWVLALAHPQWGSPRADAAQAVGSDVVVLLDLSRSMAVSDVAPSRLGAAKALIDAVAARLPANSRIGLRVFDGHSHWVHGLTTDRGVLRYFLKLAQVDTLPTRGSRVEVALDETAQALKGRKAVVWVLTDGHDPYWEPQQATPNLSHYGQQLGLIITGVGTLTGDVVHKADGGALYFRNAPARSVLRRDQLQRLATRLGGAYLDYRPDLADAIVAQLKQQKTTQALDARQWQWHSLRLWPMLLGWGLLLVALWPLRGRWSA